MKIFDTNNQLLVELPAKPKNFDGWTKGTSYGLELDGNRLKLGNAADAENARYRLTQLRRAYLDGTETFTIPKGD